MPPDVLNRAIEPFFSTCDAGGGTGLRQSIVYGFVRQTGGSFDIRSTTGKGTEIDAILPMAQMVPADTRANGNQALLVEDDRHPRRNVSQAVTKLGYACPNNAQDRRRWTTCAPRRLT